LPTYRLIPISLKVFLLAVALVTTSFYSGDIGINLADEDFWYGTTHTALGEVPIRDFQSYDQVDITGVRLGLNFGNNGIKSLRISTAISSLWKQLWLVITQTVYSIVVVSNNCSCCYCSGCTFTFLSRVSLWLRYILPFAHRRPSLLHFIAGAFVGLSAFMGINHGLYTFC